ncbi:MAG: PHP domain-containing protein [Chloroflexi bacterium]|nr:PHP domain-containing protein [Chloroflexota bacterium]
MPDGRWFKGNLHTHTTNSDGDSDPPHVAAWYRQHSYDFLVLSDHNHVTVLEDATDQPGEWPVLVPGEEVTVNAMGTPVHINAIGIRTRVEPVVVDDVVAGLQANVDAIRAAGGLASINHPNFQWAFDDRQMGRVTGAWAFEVYNGHPRTNNLRSGGRPGTEDIWDRLLSNGTRIFGVATDDAHHFKGEFGNDRSNPGRGWVMVEAKECTPGALLSAMAEGRFYSSTGIVIGELRNTSREIVIEIDPRLEEKYSVTFVGAHGRELWRSEGESARYRPGRMDEYVRAVVRSSRGASAWTQPVFVDDRVLL